MKLCPRCNTNKPPAGFYAHSKHCKSCVKWQKRQDYHADIDNARLEGRIRYNSDEAAIKRVYRHMNERS